MALEKIFYLHILQGLDRLHWRITDLWNEYQRLRERIGFPDGLDDPIFLQDKLRNLFCQDEEDILPTLKVMKRVLVYSFFKSIIELFVLNTTAGKYSKTLKRWNLFNHQ